MLAMLAAFCTYILKGGSRGSRNPQTILNFPQKDCLRSRKSIKITLFAELLTVISPNYVQSLINFSMKTLKHSIFSKKMPH